MRGAKGREIIADTKTRLTHRVRRERDTVPLLSPDLAADAERNNSFSVLQSCRADFRSGFYEKEEEAEGLRILARRYFSRRKKWKVEAVAVGRTQSSSCILEDIRVVTKQKLDLEVHFFASLWNISNFRRTN